MALSRQSYTIEQAIRAGKRLDALHARVGGDTFRLLAALGLSRELAEPAAIQLERKVRAVVTEWGGDDVAVARSCWLDGLMYGVALAETLRTR